MLTQRENLQLKMHCLTIEDLVPANHFLRKLSATVDFSFIYDEVRIVIQHSPQTSAISTVTDRR